MEPSCSTTGKLSNHQSTLPPASRAAPSHGRVTEASRPSLCRVTAEREAVEPPVHAAPQAP